MHGRARLGQEVLHDHFLDVAPASMARGDGLQRRQPIGERLADAHEDPSGVGDGQLAGCFERGEPPSRFLVGRSPVAVEVRVQRLQHHPLAGRHLAQRRQFARGHGARVGMGEQPGLVAYKAAHLDQVVDGGIPAVLGKPVRRCGVAQLGALAEGEQRFVAARPGAAGGDLQHLLGRQVWRVEPRRGLSERAVAALVAAEHGQRDEHLRAVGHPGAERVVAHGRCPLSQLSERKRCECQRCGRGLRGHGGAVGRCSVCRRVVHAVRRFDDGHRAPPFVGCC